MIRSRTIPISCIAVSVVLAQTLFAAHKKVCESARSIPIAYDVDVVVVGGSSAGVAAAVAAAEQGAKVFLAAPRPYLGEDICATYRLWLELDEQLVDPLAKQLFAVPESVEGIRYTYQIRGRHPLHLSDRSAVGREAPGHATAAQAERWQMEHCFHRKRSIR
jgi:hypothetical protein